MRKYNRLAATAFLGGCALLSNTGSANEMKKIDAGPDQTVSFPGVAQLTGSINDSEPPRLSIGWMKNAGPGEVEFSNSRQAITSATFSEPGRYTLMLGGFDGAVAYDTVTITVNP